MVVAGSAGNGIGVPGFCVFHLGEKVLMYAIRSTRSCGVSGLQEGMNVSTTPRVIVLYKSWSVGSEPVGVDRQRNSASVKSLGLGSIHCALFPSPFPSVPWHPTHQRR